MHKNLRFLSSLSSKTYIWISGWFPAQDLNRLSNWTFNCKVIFYDLIFRWQKNTANQVWQLNINAAFKRHYPMQALHTWLCSQQQEKGWHITCNSIAGKDLKSVLHDVIQDATGFHTLAYFDVLKLNLDNSSLTMYSLCCVFMGCDCQFE